MSIWTTDIRQGEKQRALQKSKKQPIESYSAHNCSSWERFECLLQPSSKEVSWIIIHIDQMKDRTVKLWWARRTRSSSSSIFFFTSFACHKCLIRPVIRLNSSFSFLGTRLLHAIQTLSNWLEKKYWVSLTKEDYMKKNGLDYDLQSVIKLSYTIMAALLPQPL